MSISTLIKSWLLPLHRHRKTKPDVFIFTLPRAGSSLLAEILNTDPTAKTASESFALDTNNARVLGKYLDKACWAERYVDVSATHFQQLTRYLEAQSEGKTWNSYYWSDIFSSTHPLRSSRTIFKIHRLSYYYGDLMHHFKDDFGLYLLRNPVAHSLSRMRQNWAEYIDLYAGSEKIKKHLTREAQIKIKEINATGSPLEKFVCSWCLENFVFIHACQNGALPGNVFPVFYEELVLEPEPVLREICRKIHMEYQENMVTALNHPSRGIVHSTRETASQIHAGNKEYLVGRWKENIDGNSLEKAREILTSFGISLYLDSL
jgi:hypothetical protein